MGNKVTTGWLKEVMGCFNRSLRLVSSKTYEEKVVPQLEAMGVEGLLQLAGLLGIGDPEALRAMAREHPCLAAMLAGEKGQKELKEWAERNRTAVEEMRRKLALLERVGRPIDPPVHRRRGR